MPVYVYRVGNYNTSLNSADCDDASARGAAKLRKRYNTVG